MELYETVYLDGVIKLIYCSLAPLVVTVVLT